MLGIYIPTFGRAHKLRAVADNIKATTHGEWNLYWCIEEHDEDSKRLAPLSGNVIINHGKPCYSDALQEIYEQTEEDIFLWGNDDFFFLPNWNEQPLKMMEENKDIGVLGIRDGNPNTRFSTISLIRRKYIEEQSGVIDMPNRVLYPYHHNYVDDELTATAQKRGVWSHCTEPAILHQHHSFKWLGDFPHDATYAKNDKNFALDNATYHDRVHLWS